MKDRVDGSFRNEDILLFKHRFTYEIRSCFPCVFQVIIIFLFGFFSCFSSMLQNYTTGCKKDGMTTWQDSCIVSYGS